MVHHNKIIYKNKSFSIIEIIISISVVSIISLFLFPKYQDFILKNKLENFGNEVFSLIELAKKKAMSGETENASCSQGTYAYGVIKEGISSAKIKLCLYCQENTNSCKNIKEIIIPQDVTIEINSSPSFLFNVLSGMPFYQNEWIIKSSRLNENLKYDCLSISVNNSSVIEITSLYEC